MKIGQTIKTLILEFLEINGAGHLREIHLGVTEFRVEVPQHTVRARLSEMSRSDNLEEKLASLGDGFYGLYEENKDLCSVVSYPDRGPWGNAQYRRNCSGWLAKDLILRFKVESVFDPAEGSGTVKEVVEESTSTKQKASTTRAGTYERIGHTDQPPARQTVRHGLVPPTLLGYHPVLGDRRTSAIPKHWRIMRRN